MPPATERRPPLNLATQITALVICVATLVGLVAAALTLQLLRATIEDQTRTQLRQQLDIAASRGNADEGIRAAIDWAQHTGALYVVIDDDGQITGSATAFVTDQLLAELDRTSTVSDLRVRPSEPVILEGSAIGDGGLVLARLDLVLPQASRALVVRVLPILVAGVIAAIIGGAFLARRITRPLVATARAATALADGDRNLPLPDANVTEVRAVAQALTALDRALVESENRQHEFLLSISHEIRTPLTAIRGYGEALTDGVLPPGTAGEVIQTEAERLSRFLDDLLELARLESDDFRISPSRADLVETLGAAEHAWRARARLLDVTIALDTPPAPVEVDTDVRRIRQIIDGLVENALRVSPPGSTIVLRLAATAAGPTISVVDQGPGIDPTHLGRAFDRGFLHDRYRTSRPVGTGLGLSIAARLTARLGGTIEASPADDGGACFTVSLYP